MPPARARPRAQIYTPRRDWPACYTICRYLRATRPDDAEVLRDAGVCLFLMERRAESAAALREYLARAPPGSQDAGRIRQLLRSMGAAEPP